MDLIPGLGRSLGVGNGNPLQYSSLENSMGYSRILRFTRSYFLMGFPDGSAVRNPPAMQEMQGMQV